eukprot:CAMPEP_0202858430 /NCGR_PEP_ID=MMETSP1391-20130828/971_1 /ASSEMBLY_ACC=CAM_ASM_000867 /TAXON_ID=1034604 /ORGANISM="Chlamydomonas leiostraca, Strain SAG 11-49" /LENGTH=218 /DNA_ID=CAMNT_0049537351 /DNA_START=166 /DNA_END=819 /DNA_ORIENTATION=+
MGCKRPSHAWLAWLLLALIACTGFAQELSAEELSDAEASLEEGLYYSSDYDPSNETAAIATFPFCVCDDYRCASSPYRIQQQRPQVGSVNTKLCYTFEYLGDVPNPTTCYTKMQTHLEKIELEVDKKCKPAVIGATLNGARRTFYYMDTFPTGTLRVTKLNLNAGNASGALLCLTITNNKASAGGFDCTSPFGLYNNHDGMAKYSLFESSDHRCCPTC